jgi:hypothetical protein
VLVKNGCDPNVPSIRGDTPLHYAARLRRTDLVALLISGGILFDRDYDGYTFFIMSLLCCRRSSNGEYEWQIADRFSRRNCTLTIDRRATPSPKHTHNVGQTSVATRRVERGTVANVVGSVVGGDHRVVGQQRNDDGRRGRGGARARASSSSSSHVSHRCQWQCSFDVSLFIALFVV